MEKEIFACGKLLVKSIFEKNPKSSTFSLLHKLVKFVYFFRPKTNTEKVRIKINFGGNLCIIAKKQILSAFAKDDP